ncbi:MAG TPA: RNA pseudouridine synthase, partial [Stenotrophomonas sp.]|nr:RNA pseudouridine synthase [Stenotrophomonas sp.]
MSEQTSESARQAIVPDTAAGRRFDAVVAELFPEYSRSRLTEWIKSGDVLLDGAQARPRDPLRGGEVVSLTVVLDTQTDAQPEDIPLDVLFEDEHLLVINKPV